MNGNGHHELAPSSFPAWMLCPAFDSDPAERADAAEGTRQHTALAALLRDPRNGGEDSPALAGLSPDAREAVTWAAGYVRTLAGAAPILTDHPVSFTAPDGFAKGGASEIFFGTADVLIVHPPGNMADLVDFKSGADDWDHRPQLAGYALALFSMRTRLKTVRAHILYGRVRRVDAWALTQADAAGVVLPILDARRDPARRSPAACGYCGFCVHRVDCPALTSQVAVVGEAAPAWEELAPAIREPGAVTDPVLAAKALTLARHVSVWADAIRARATELAKGGATLPGYRLQERRGPREVSDLGAALLRSGLQVPMFLSACKLSLPRLAEAVAESRAIRKAAAAREVETMLDGLIREGPPSVALVSDRTAAADPP